VECRPDAGQRPRKQLCNSRYWVTASQTSVFPRQQLDTATEKRFLYGPCRDASRIYKKTDPSSRQRGCPTKTRPQLSNSNKYLVISPRWGSTPRLTDWLTVSRNVTLTFWVSSPLEGGLGYLHRNPTSRRRRLNVNPVPEYITEPPCSGGI
jgi:hypothetical protein